MPEGAGAERVRYMIGACRHEHMFRVAPPEFSWKQLAVAADMAAWSAAEASATVFAAEAVHAGCRVVATRTRVACELLGEGYPWLCRPNDPQGAAATMLRALGNPPPTPCPAPGWCTECAPEHAAARYVEVYTRLAARRPVV
jgi:glycosyltransferase involved in cell wall biosynthesis